MHSCQREKLFGGVENKASRAVHTFQLQKGMGQDGKKCSILSKKDKFGGAAEVWFQASMWLAFEIF